VFCGHPVTGLLQALAELCSLKSGLCVMWTGTDLLQALAELCSLKSGLCVLWTSCDWSVAGFGRAM